MAAGSQTSMESVTTIAAVQGEQVRTNLPCICGRRKVGAWPVLLRVGRQQLSGLAGD